MTTNHEARTGQPYDPKSPRTDEQRRAASEAMKAFHRKTKAGTRLGNDMARKAKRT